MHFKCDKVDTDPVLLCLGFVNANTPLPGTDAEEQSSGFLLYLCAVKALKRTLFLLSAVCTVLSAAAAETGQDLPALGKASEITSGMLPDGISYYLVKNASLPGFADFALVQPLRKDRTGPREDLVDLPHFSGRKPYDFLASWGISYPKGGYVRHLRDATVFRLEEVPVSFPEAADSTLLMLFDIARSSDYEQALIVCGDIDVSAILERIRILSMTISQRMPAADAWSYDWSPQERALVTTGTAPAGTILVSYRSPRTDRALMNTIQPVMSRMLATEMELILTRRLRSAFDRSGIPLADCRCRYTGSDETAGDEMFSLSVLTAPERLDEALRTTAAVLSGLDSEGVSDAELSFARGVVSSTTLRDAGNIRMSNAEYLDKCLSSYLYGGNLASASSLSSFFIGRKLDDQREKELLNRYISAMISGQRNMHLHVRSVTKPNEASVSKLFSEGWAAGGSAYDSVPVQDDTLKLLAPKRKAKLKSTSADQFSGGKMWTFSNGISVVFKKTSDKDAFHYGLMVKGGWAEIPGIKGSEPSFARDVLSTFRISGMSGERFKDLLAMNGISIAPDISLSDIRFTGSAPKNALPLVLKTMLSIANATEADHAAFDRYRKEKAVRLVRDKFSEEGTRAVLDSIMCPMYAFATGSMPELPGNGFDTRLCEYVSAKGATLRNGIIVLAGDLDEAATLKLLTHSLGDFRTGGQRVVRPKQDFPLRSCWSTTSTTHNWRENGVSVSLSAFCQFGSESNLQLQLACEVLEAKLNEKLVGMGQMCSVEGYSSLLPAERITVFVHCTACPPAGVPADVVPASPTATLAAIRSVINSLATKDVETPLLNRCKTKLTNTLSAEEGSTALMRDAVLQRHALGRDIKNRYKESIKSVSASRLREMYASLVDCTCEYVVE